MFLVFDLDGTIIDTKQAVYAAYASVGVQMPEDAWGKPWYEWLDDSDAHRRKAEVYHEFIPGYSRPLPLLDIALEEQVPIITGASSNAVASIKQHYGDLNVVRSGCSLEDKGAMLDNLQFEVVFQYGHHKCIYVDDCERTRAYLQKERTTWEILSPQVYLMLSPQDYLASY